MSGLINYGFLLDENVSGLLELFPKHRARAIPALGHAGASDEKVIAFAAQAELIIVTNNSTDYRTKMAKYSAQCSEKQHCADIGLLILPNDRLDQERFFPLHKTEARLQLDGMSVKWATVAALNLLVRADRDGSVRIEQLPRCATCIRRSA